jgi:hypothetical protein
VSLDVAPCIDVIDVERHEIRPLHLRARYDSDMARNRTLGSPFEIDTVSQSVTVEAHVDLYAVDAALGTPVTVTLDPGAFHGDQVSIQDVGDNAFTQPITVLCSPGQTILNGLGASYAISMNGAGIQLTFDEPLGGWVPVLLSSSAGSSGSGPWTEVSGIIDANDVGAGVSAAGARGLVGRGAFGFGVAAKAVNPGDFALTGGTASGGPSIAAFNGAIASGANSVALAGGTAVGPNSMAFGLGAVANHAFDVALANGTASGGPSFAAFFGTASLPGDFAVGGQTTPLASIAEGGDSVAFAGGTASAIGAFAVGLLPGRFPAPTTPSIASGEYSAAFGGGVASGNLSFAFGQLAIASQTSSFAGPLGTASGANATAFNGSATAIGAFAAADGTAEGEQSVSFCGGGTGVAAANSASIGANLVTAQSAYKMGTDTPTATASGLLAVNADGAGTVLITLGNNHTLDIENATISATTATAGAGTLPAAPVGFLDVTMNGTAFKIPYYSP